MTTISASNASSADALETFTALFAAHADSRDKTDSQYTIVVYDMPKDEVIEKVKHHIRLINKLGDRVKRIYLEHKLFLLRTELEKRGDDDAGKSISTVFLVDSGDTIHEIPLHPRWLAVLREWDVDHFLFRYGDIFDIAFLRDLFLNTAGRHVIHVHNNKLTHFRMTTTKRRIVHSEETKSLDVAAYVTAAVPKDQCALVHGVSGLLKGIKLDPRHLLSSTILRETEIMDLFERETTSVVHRELAEWFGAMLNPKLAHRVVFGSEIKKRIQAGELQTLFATPIVATKIREKVPADQLRTFEIREIRTMAGPCLSLHCATGDVADMGKRLEHDHAGALGVTYY